MERYTSSMILGAFIGFCCGVIRSLAVGGTLFDFISATPQTISHSVTAVDLAFIGMLLGLCVNVLLDTLAEIPEGTRDNEGQEAGEDWVEVKTGNRIARLYCVDRDALQALSAGKSRRASAKDGITETRFNKASNELRKAGIVRPFDVLE